MSSVADKLDAYRRAEWRHLGASSQRVCQSVSAAGKGFIERQPINAVIAATVVGFCMVGAAPNAAQPAQAKSRTRRPVRTALMNLLRASTVSGLKTALEAMLRPAKDPAALDSSAMDFAKDPAAGAQQQSSSV